MSNSFFIFSESYEYTLTEGCLVSVFAGRRKAAAKKKKLKKLGKSKSTDTEEEEGDDDQDGGELYYSCSRFISLDYCPSSQHLLTFKRSPLAFRGDSR